jgi:hypothetical protein
MAKKYMTVVIEYENGAKTPLEFTQAFSTEDSKYGDSRITAISMEDQISRVEQLEQSLE